LEKNKRGAKQKSGLRADYAIDLACSLDLSHRRQPGPVVHLAVGRDRALRGLGAD
jgi:hypothetical protein